ncbi:MAG: hypothetical protein ACRDQ7_09905 [Haloechinothrix sp.]
MAPKTEGDPGCDVASGTGTVDGDDRTLVAVAVVVTDHHRDEHGPVLRPHHRVSAATTQACAAIPSGSGS